MKQSMHPDTQMRAGAISATTARSARMLALLTSLLSTALAADTNESANSRSQLPELPSPLTDQDFLNAGQENPALYELGRHLFFDPILSGNRNISCGTCHDPSRGTSDAVALSIGEGGTGIGPARRTQDGVTGRVPRNAQSLYNIGAREYTAFFHDGRLSEQSTHLHGAGFVKLDSERLPDDLDSILATQALFPVTSAVEMAGQAGENPIANAVAQYRLSGEGGAWDLLAERMRRIPGYVSQFLFAFPEIKEPEEITYSHAARALAHFQATAFRSTNSRYDRLLATKDASSWSYQERKGLDLFYGEAGCADCHSGPLLTDHEFHAIAMPQIGPGKGHGTDKSYLLSSGFPDRLEDEGRYRATLDMNDHFRFRTPSLRNVALTGPWSHAGAYDSLADVVRHHIDPVSSIERYGPEGAERLLPRLEKVLDSTGRGPARQYHLLDHDRRDAFHLRRGFVQGSHFLRSRIARANELNTVTLTEQDMKSIIAFLNTLTDPQSADQSHLIPSTLPSGLVPQPRPAELIR